MDYYGDKNKRSLKRLLRSFTFIVSKYGFVDINKLKNNFLVLKSIFKCHLLPRKKDCVVLSEDTIATVLFLVCTYYIVCPKLILMDYAKKGKN